MDPISIAAIILTQIAKYGPTLIKTIDDAAPYAEKLVDLITGGNATQADLDAFLETIKANSAQIQAPIDQ